VIDCLSGVNQASIDPRHAVVVAVRESVASRGERRSRLLRARFTEGIVTARAAAGLSRRELARRIGVSEQTWARGERGDHGTLTVDLAARMAPAVGLELALTLYPAGDPVRDRGQLALLGRLRRRIPDAPGWRVEVPVPIAGDLRSGDAMVTVDEGDILIEAETHLDDVQAVERKGAAKARDLGAIRLVILLADTRHNRRVIHDHPELRVRFPIDTRTCLARLARGVDPGDDALVIL
jgi:transcriptional regulator with XRE-family HTH domain